MHSKQYQHRHGTLQHHRRNHQGTKSRRQHGSKRQLRSQILLEHPISNMQRGSVKRKHQNPRVKIPPNIQTNTSGGQRIGRNSRNKMNQTSMQSQKYVQGLRRPNARGNVSEYLDEIVMVPRCITLDKVLETPTTPKQDVNQVRTRAKHCLHAINCLRAINLSSSLLLPIPTHCQR